MNPLLLLVLLAAAVLPAPAQDAAPAPSTLVIAVVDLEAVFARHPATAAATRELTAARDAAREEFKETSNRLKEILQNHQELIRAGKRDAAAEELKKANEAERSIAALKTTNERDITEKFRKAKVAIMEEITAAVAEFNADGRYALVLDRSAASSNGLPQVVHAPGAVDITAEVIAFITKRDEP